MSLRECSHHAGGWLIESEPITLYRIVHSNPPELLDFSMIVRSFKALVTLCVATFVAGLVLVGVGLSTMDLQVVYTNPHYFGPLLTVANAAILGIIAILGLIAYFGFRAKSVGVGLVLAAVLSPIWIWKPATAPFWSVIVSLTVVLGVASFLRRARS